jgi:transcriptional regulator with XRE-family HTH domain
VEKTEIRSILAKNLKFYRHKHGWSQAELAEKAKITPNFLSDIETCKKWPYPETLQNISDALHIDVFKLFVPNTPMEASATDILNQYTEDISLLVVKSQTELLKSINKIREKY